MNYNHHHVSHQPLNPPGNSPPYPPSGFPPPPPPVGITHTHHFPSPPPPPGYQGYYYEGEGRPSLSPGLPPQQLHPRNNYYHNHIHSGCTSFITGCLATLCCCCLLEDCIY